MSPKSRLGRDPFERSKAKKPTGRKPSGSKTARTRRQRVYRRPKRVGIGQLLTELTHYWLPRVRACAYVRAVKFVSRFT